MLTAQKYSMLIPTFNRPKLLNALLDYLANKKAQFPIYILDSSALENKIENRVVAKRHALNVRHLEFNEDARLDSKIGTALREIGSDYVSLCADDDIVFVNAIEQCIDELDFDATLVACHGIYLNFDVSRPLVKLNIEYASPSIDMDDAVERACQLLMRYEALNYAVYRRHVMVDIIDAVAQTPQTMFWELFSALAPLVDGKVKRLARLYHGRRSHVAVDRTVQHPATWIASDPEDFAEAFLTYREQLFKYFQAKGVDVGPAVRKAITQAHVIYFCRELRDGTGIKQALNGTSSPLVRIAVVRSNTIPGQLSPLNAWFRVRTKNIPLLGTDSWFRRRIKKLMAPSDMICFKGHGQSIAFMSVQSVRAMLTDEIVTDFSRYCRATVGL
jgi:glycosyltransferase domain-containing protein